MQLLLVFAREDPHIITLKNAALNCGYTIKCCHNIEETHEAFKKVNYDLVFIDCRRSTSMSTSSVASTSSQQQQQQSSATQQSTANQYDYDNICRFIRKLFHYTVIVALTHNFDERDLPSVLPLLKTGFNKTFTETTNLNRCINELLTLEYGEIQNVKRLQAAHVLFTALEFSSDSVEIMNDQFKLLYANNSFEKLTGFTLSDISGQDFSTLHRNAEEFTSSSRHFVSQGHALECELSFAKANGECVNHKSIIIPVTFQGETNKIQNYVTITSLSDTNKNVMNVRSTTNSLQAQQASSNQLATTGGMVSNKRSFSLPSKKSYDFERFANMSLCLAEESTGQSSSSASATAATAAGSGKQTGGNKITLSLTTPALSSASPAQQLSNAQSNPNAHLLASTPSTTSTTLNEQLQDDLDDLDRPTRPGAATGAAVPIPAGSQPLKNEIAKSSPEFQQDLHSISNSVSQRKRSYDVRSTPFENITLPPRRHSTTRFHQQTVEAPIRKVINIIAAANEKSTTEAVRLNLEKALDILRSTELYNPSLLENDKHTSDLVSGLMSNGMQRKIPIGNLLGITANRPPLFTVSSRDSQSYVKNLPPEIVEILENDKAWNFDIISLERLSNKRPLVTLGLKIMNRFDVCDCLKIDEKILVNWLTLIESNYKPTNPYHNSTHASDVLHATSYFLSADKISDILDSNDKVASLIAAAVHDLNHPGRTNAFLCNSNNDLAILYNDQAVLENHHVSLAFQLTRQSDDINIFKNLTRDEYRVLRSIIIDMVLATEMSKHFEHLNKFLNKFGSSDDEKPPIKSIEQLRQPDNKCLIKRILIKCADVSNPCRPLDICKEWSKRIAAEYFEQTDEEKSSNLPVVMPTFDRQSCNIPKAQLSFIEYFINDMFAAWDEFADIPEVMSFLQANTLYWRECAEAQQLQLLQQQAQTHLEQQQNLPSNNNNNIINEDNENERD